jgi:hypothetical protein
MNAFASYLRHLIVTVILLAVEKLKLPIEGADKAADVIALAVVGTLSWWFVKYVAPKIKVPKGSGLALFALAASLALLTPSCNNLTPDQNGQLVDAAERIIIHATK